MADLPEDCVHYILKYLQNSHSTLFNCLLINRFWCNVTVPFLYADPFDAVTCKKTKKHYSILLTLISCFSKKEILQLKNQLKHNNIININDKYKSLFEYPKYLKNFDYDKIKTVIFHWLCLHGIHNHNELDGFISIFYHSVLRRIICVKQLNISLYLFKNWSVQTNLTKLISLKLDLDVKNNRSATECLSNIINSCLNLKKLEITSSYIPIDANSKKLCTIIQKQNNLKAFKLSYRYCSSFLSSILLSLEFQKHSLVYIEFKSINFRNVSFKNFINLYNLKYLKFYNCNGAISLTQCEALKCASFKLKKLEFKNDGRKIIRWNDLITSSMIKYLGTSLEELILFDEPNISTVQNISNYCLSLIKLEIRIESNFDLLMFPYFKNLNIRILNIIDSCSDWSTYTSIETFKNLANNLPTNVKEVSLFSVTPLYFREFLENCHHCLEVINLNYRSNYSNEIELETLKVILNYIEKSNNSLKVWGMCGINVSNDEELKLLDQIKAKGVKIVDHFYSICEDNSSFIV